VLHPRFTNSHVLYNYHQRHHHASATMATTYQHPASLASPTSPTSLPSSSWYYSTAPSSLPPATMTVRTSTTVASKKKKQKSAKKPRWNTLPLEQLEAKVAEREARQARAKRLAEDKGRAAANLGNGEFARNVGHKGKKNKRRHRDIAGDATADKGEDLEGEGRAAKRQARGPQHSDHDDITMAGTLAGGEVSGLTQAELDQAAMRRARELVAEEVKKAQAVAEPVAVPALPSPASESMDVDTTRGTSIYDVEPVSEKEAAAHQEDAAVEETVRPADLPDEPVEIAAVEAVAVPEVAPIPSVPTPQGTSSTDETPAAPTEPATTIVTTSSDVTETSALADPPVDDTTAASATTSPSTATIITAASKRTTKRPQRS